MTKKKLGFMNLEYPADWQETMTVIRAPTENPDFVSNFSLSQEPGGRQTLKELASEARQAIVQPGYPNLKFQNDGECVIAGVKSYRFEIIHDLPLTGSEKSIELRRMHVLIAAEDTTYSLSLAAPKDDRNSWDAFETMLKSISF